ncbi:rhodanese-like domain-containing protein [Dysgonomonas sp. GY617]|uniref:rhodanese-like domain-containing protein n=1 Tax=Dysgonomonas sp. GY617 TaxID=2780420 RepID=UPI00188428CB|nr:rhodanese-like domain-containing protein [Dysgonomonas sp. GY617]MBF0575151.1 rhodanese-like domain-containing protein [Dysgonomonas sp. GY617]
MKPLYVLIMGIALSTSYTMAQSCHEQTITNDSVISRTEQPQYEVIKQLVDEPSTIIIDVRTPEEFEEGHIETSVNMPLQTLEDSLLPLKEYKNIVIVCKSGKRAEQAKTLLTLKGFTNVYNAGGWQTLDTKLKSKK